ncbi:unnamed protein product [Blepharisma stoltei]|uniref:Uncharacterized protein n=1 Tax=Blepharisma stoltei TaxID=1481888 RepID=A0AAU9JSB5_9CILI|nr:unnamed protein product [Blepharisma stoltei]
MSQTLQEFSQSVSSISRSTPTPEFMSSSPLSGILLEKSQSVPRKSQNLEIDVTFFKSSSTTSTSKSSENSEINPTPSPKKDIKTNEIGIQTDDSVPMTTPGMKTRKSSRLALFHEESVQKLKRKIKETEPGIKKIKL